MTDPIRSALEQAAHELDIAENALLCSSFHNAASRAKQAAMTARAALSQPEPAGLSDEAGMIPMEYADADSDARIVCVPSEDRPSTGCWVVPNSRHISPFKEFPTAEAAYHALRAAIAADRAQRQPVPLSERPWEREGWCDEQGRCWALNEHLPAWEFHDCADSRKWADLFLPAHALPLPGEVES